MTMTVGRLAAATGVNVSTVRYYERRGLIPPPRRTATGYRQYETSIVARIRFIKAAQRLGFSLDEIGDLLSLRVDAPGSCRAVVEATRAKLTATRSRIEELERLELVLERLVRSCLDGGRTDDCPVLAMLDEGGPP